MYLFRKFLYSIPFGVTLGCLCLSNSVTANITQPVSNQTQTNETSITVTELVVKGTEGKLADVVKQAIKIKLGSKTTRSGLQNEVNNIYATGYFSNVRVIPEDVPKGVRVTVEVTVNPVLRRVEIKGDTVVPTKVISEIFSQQYGSILNLKTLYDNYKKLIKWYQENGYVLASIIDFPKVSQDGVVKLQVAEGVIEEIGVKFVNKEGKDTDNQGKSIAGNAPIDFILKQISSKPGQVLNRKQWEKDLQRVFELGIFDDAQLQLDPGKEPSKVIVRLKVVENDYVPAFNEFLKQVRGKLVTTSANKSRIEEAEILRWKGHRTTSSKKEDKRAFAYYQAALKIFQEEKDIVSTAKVYNNIGNAYKEQKDYPNAISNYENALKTYQSQKNKLGQAIVNNNLGNLYIQNQQYDKAVDSYEQAQKLFAEQKELFWQALSLSNLAYSYYYSDNKDKAVEYYSQAIATWKNVKQPASVNKIAKSLNFQSPEQADSFNFQFGSSTSNGTFLESLIQLDDKLKIRLDDKNFWFLITLFNSASAFQSAGDYQQAMYIYNDALELWQVIKKDKVLYSLNNDNVKDKNILDAAKLVEIGFDTLLNLIISNLYNDLGEKQLSSQYRQLFVKDIQKNAPVVLAEIFKNSDSAIAKNLLISIAPIFMNLLNQPQNTELLNAEIFKDIDLSQLLNFVKQTLPGNKNPSRNQIIEAVSQPFLQYFNIILNAGDADKLAKIDESNKLQAIALHQKNIAALKNIKNEDLCIDRLLPLIAENQNTQNQLQGLIKDACVLNTNAQQAKSLNAIARIQLDLKQDEKVIEILTQARLLLQADAAKPLKDMFDGQSTQKLQEEISTFGKNSNPNDLSQYSSIINYFNQAIANNKVKEAKTTTAETLSLMGQAYIAKQKYQDALESYNSSLGLYQAIDDIFKQADTRLAIANIERKRGDLIQAKTEIEKAIEIIESERAQASNQKPKKPESNSNSNETPKSPEVQKKLSSYKSYLDLAKYLESKQNYYDFYIDLLMQLHAQQPSSGYDVLAFQASEGSKSRSLRAIVNRSLNKNNKSQTNESKAENNYIELAKVPSLAEIQQQLLDENTVLLEYALGEERSYLWAVTKNSIQTYQLPKRSQIDTLSRQFINFLKSPYYHLATRGGINAIPNTDVAQLPKIGNQLSDAILAPVAEKIGNKRLLIVSDGALQYVPFAALPKSTSKSTQNKEIKPLLVDHEIISLPSASLQILSQRKNTLNKSSKTLAMLADPIFSRNDERVKIQNPSTSTNSTSTNLAIARIPTWERLSGTRQEASQISSFLPDSQKLVKFNSAANYSTATSSELSKYRFIHFATHGVFDAQRPERSGVIFSTFNEQGNPQRSLLSTSDAFKLNLSADLVVLSACSTALGKEIKGEGLIGLTGGLMYAGSKSVVSSFWDVEDNGTAELMSQFYSKMLKDKQSPSTALRNAQLYMWNSSKWQAPYYWAAFGIQGTTVK